MRPGRLPEAADRFGTPAHVCDADAVRARLGVLRDLFGSHPKPLEILHEGGAPRDVSGSRLNREDAA